MSSDSVTDEEKHLIDEHLRLHFKDEVPRSYHNIVETKAKKKLFGSNTSKRILVVSTYHLFIFRKKPTEFIKNIHYYDIKEIESDASQQLIFKVKPHDLRATKALSPPTSPEIVSSPENPTSPRITAKSENNNNNNNALPIELPVTNYTLQCSNWNQIVTDIRNAYQLLSFSFPDEHKIAFKTSTSAELETAPERGKDKGFFAIYKAWCHYYQTTPNSEFQLHLEDLVNRNQIDLDLSNCVGIEPKSEISLDLAPITAALRFDTYFRSFQLRNVSRREVVGQIAETMLTNTFLTKLILEHVDGDEKSYVELGLALRTNTKHSLQILQLSDKGFGTKAAIALSEGLTNMTHALQVLDLSGCSIQAKGVTALFAGLEQNYPMSLTIQRLNLSGNSFDKHGSMAMNLWMREPKSYLHLEKLQLANSTLVIPMVDIFKTLHRLTEIDFSGVKIDTAEGCIGVAYLCEQNEGLKKLRLSNCGLVRESLETIHEAVTGNAMLKKIEYDLSYNSELAAKPIVTYLSTSFTKATCFHSLNLSGIKMKEESVVELVNSLAKTKGLEKLYLNHVLNISSNSTKDSKALNNAFQALLTNNGVNSLRVLEISHGFGRQFVTSLVEVIKPHFTLQVLNIAGNSLGDKGADTLAGLFRYNSHLLAVNFDDNKMTGTGFASIGAALVHNKTLVKLQFVEDFEKAAHAIDDITKKTALYKIGATIHKTLEENEKSSDKKSLAIVDSLLGIEHIPTPTTVAPLTDLPEFLKQHSTVISFTNVPEFVAQQQNARKQSIADLSRNASANSAVANTTASTSNMETSEVVAKSPSSSSTG